MNLLNPASPAVWFVGDVSHSDFAEAARLLAGATGVGPHPPELIVVAQSRPGAIAPREFLRWRRLAPLAGIIALVGSWCEGETRSGRPAAGVDRLYWHEFPRWWRRQLSLWTAGRCPEWARVDDSGLSMADCQSALANQRAAIATTCFDSATAIADVVQSAGATSVWMRPELEADWSGVTLGIWDGGQLDPPEIDRLASFCINLRAPDVPIVALLDFPRRDCCEVARQIGAAAVIGKPWTNGELVATLQDLTRTPCALHAA